MLLQETHFKYKDSDRLKVKVWRKKDHANTSQVSVNFRENEVQDTENY